jgi:hypothetical protein
MEQAALSPLAVWDSFYVIVGSSAAALTGLQFVVIVLGAEADTAGSATTRAFGTPTVVHFCAVLFVAAVLSAPWHALSSVGLVLGACGVAGVAYALQVVRHARRQTAYVPVFEDWLWHGVLPLIGYGALLFAAAFLRRHPASASTMHGILPRTSRSIDGRDQRKMGSRTEHTTNLTPTRPIQDESSFQQGGADICDGDAYNSQ